MNREQRRASGHRGPAVSALDAMTDHRIPGGCDDCNAYQTVEQQHPGIYVMTVHHDATCPYLARRTAR